MGGERATCWGACHLESVIEANEHVLVMPIIESVEGGKNIQGLCKVEGVEMFFVGPADYSATVGFPGQWEGGDTADQLLAVNDTVRRHKKSCGVICRNHEELVTRAEQGFRLLGLGLDGSILVNSLLDSLAHVGIQRSITPTMDRQVDSASG